MDILKEFKQKFPIKNKEQIISSSVSFEQYRTQKTPTENQPEEDKVHPNEQIKVEENPQTKPFLPVSSLISPKVLKTKFSNS